MPVRHNNSPNNSLSVVFTTEFDWCRVQCRYMFWLIEPSSGYTSTSLILLKSNTYMDPYVVLISVCYKIKWKIWCASVTFPEHLKMVILIAVPFPLPLSDQNLCIHEHSHIIHNLILKMDATCISERSATLPTSTQCKDPRRESTSLMDHCESLKWVAELSKLWHLFQISVPLSCLPKYSDNDVPGSTYPQLDRRVPEATKCYHELQFFDEGAQWRSQQDPCTMCNCHQNLVKCDTVPCPPLTCSSRTAPGECCPSCTSKSL
jgi:hypothetical protein